MADFNTFNFSNRTETERSTNEVLPQSKMTPCEEWSLDDGKFTLEGWCHRENIPSSLEVMSGNMDSSQFSDDPWAEDATQHNVFKNALANLSEGLAEMHRKDIENNVNINVGNQKAQSFRVKSKSNVIIKKVKEKKTRNLEIYQEKEKENIITNDSKNKESHFAKKDENSDRIVSPLPYLEAKCSLKAELNDESKKGFDDLNTDESANLENRTLEEKVDRMQETNISEDLVQPSKINSKENERRSLSHKELDIIEIARPAHLIKRTQSAVPQKSRQLATQKSPTMAQHIEIRVNRNSLQYRQSPSHDISNSDLLRITQRAATPSIPTIQNSKTLVPLKELNFNDQELKLDGVKAKTNKNNEKDGYQAINKKIEPLHPISIEGKTANLRTVLGQAFTNFEGAPLYNLNLKSNPKKYLKKQGSPNNENFNSNYLLSIHNFGFKHLNEKSSNLNNNTSGSFKVIDCFKRASQIQPRSSNIGNNENMSILEPLQEKTFNQRENIIRPEIKPQGKNEASFRVKKTKSNVAEKKVSFQEIVFQK